MVYDDEVTQTARQHYLGTMGVRKPNEAAYNGPANKLVMEMQHLRKKNPDNINRIRSLCINDVTKALKD